MTADLKAKLTENLRIDPTELGGRRGPGDFLEEELMAETPGPLNNEHDTEHAAEHAARAAGTHLERWVSQYLANRRRLGTVAAVSFALLLTWHVISGRNGLSSWQQKRAENKALAREVEELTQENARLGQHVDRLRSDPGAIEHEARSRLRYARPNEIIWALPEEKKPAPAAR